MEQYFYKPKTLFSKVQQNISFNYKVLSEFFCRFVLKLFLHAFGFKVDNYCTKLFSVFTVVGNKERNMTERLKTGNKANRINKKRSYTAL